MKRIRRAWVRLAGAPARALAKRLTARFPRETSRDIQLLVGDERVVHLADRFFAKTRSTLDALEARAPGHYASFTRDVRTIVLRSDPVLTPLNRFQLAALVPGSLIDEADETQYAAWLVYAGNLLHGSQAAADALHDLLHLVAPEHEARVESWLRTRMSVGSGC